MTQVISDLLSLLIRLLADEISRRASARQHLGLLASDEDSLTSLLADLKEFSEVIKRRLD